ncbi:GtrA family protein [Nocardia sp. NPDC050712]|uniref:GtrA family protein n=1 Tax=Nocardia sp. NPDC050712 TaxID=3155518 RepID=UPI0033C4981D
MDRSLRNLLTGSGPVASFCRYALVGGSNGLVSSVAVTLLALVLPFALANAVITIASTLVGTHLHARFTFTATTPDWRRHLQSAGTAAAAYALTSAAMLLLPRVCADPTIWTEQLVYLTASALAGVLRFAALRVLVFDTTPPRITMPKAPVHLTPSGFIYAFAANPA